MPSMVTSMSRSIKLILTVWPPFLSYKRFWGNYMQNVSLSCESFQEKKQKAKNFFHLLFVIKFKLTENAKCVSSYETVKASIQARFGGFCRSLCGCRKVNGFQKPA